MQSVDGTIQRVRHCTAAAHQVAFRAGWHNHYRPLTGIRSVSRCSLIAILYLGHPLIRKERAEQSAERALTDRRRSNLLETSETGGG